MNKPGTNNPFAPAQDLAAQARSRFPDLNDASNGQSSWKQPTYSNLAAFTPQPQSPYGQLQAGFPSLATGAGLASPLSYNNPAAIPATSPQPPLWGTSAGPGSYSLGGAFQYAVTANGAAGMQRPTTAPPDLSFFDPLSPRQQQPLAGGGGFFTDPSRTPSQLFSTAPTLDPHPLTYHPRQPHNPNTQTVSGFGGQIVVHLPIRGHRYTQQDHPRAVVQLHKNELEQWDQYGWKQALNAFESLRLAWVAVKEDIERAGAASGAGLEEKAILNAMHKDVVDNIDRTTAAYLQMHEVFSNYRQSPDAASKSRVKDGLNAGLRNLPEWP